MKLIALPLILPLILLLVGCSTTLNKKYLADNNKRDSYADDVDLQFGGGDFEDYYQDEEFKIKRVAIISVATSADTSAMSKVSAWKTRKTSVSFSSYNFQIAAEKTHKEIVKELKSRGLEVVTTAELMKHKEYYAAGKSLKKPDKGWFKTVDAAAFGGNKFTAMKLYNDDEYLDALSKKLNIDAFVYVSSEVFMKLGDSKSVDGVEGYEVATHMRTKSQVLVPYHRFKAAGGSSGFVDNNHNVNLDSGLFDFKIFFPTESKGKSKELTSKAWNELGEEAAEIFRLQFKKLSDDQEIMQKK